MQYLIFLNHWTFVLALFFCGPLFILWLYVITGLRSKFDPLFKNRGSYKGEVGFFPWSPILRGTSYAGCIAYPTLLGKKHTYVFKLYHGYDFRKDCNIVHIIISWIFITFGFLAGLLGVIHIGFSWLLGVPAFPQN